MSKVKLSDEIAPYFHSNFHNWSTVHQIDVGGRGSTKSTKNAKKLAIKWKNNKDMHIVVIRRYNDSHKDSTAQAIIKQLNWLGLKEGTHYQVQKRPVHIKNLITGQNIYFRGLDDFDKIKGIEVPFGFIGAVWFFEITEFRVSRDMGEVIATFARGIKQDRGQFFVAQYEYNPSAKPNHWSYPWVEMMRKRNDAIVIHSNFEMLPLYLAEKWLGKIWLEEARNTFESNPNLYKNQYLGQRVILTGGIYTAFDENNVADIEIHRNYKLLVVAWDFGERDSTTAIVTGITKNMKYEVVDQYWHKNNISPIIKNINDYVADAFEFVKKIKNRYPKVPIKIVVDSHELSFYNLLRQKLLTNNVIITIDKVNKKKKDNNSTSQISERIKISNILFHNNLVVVDNKCGKLINAIQDCIYEENSDKHLDNGTSDIDSMDAFHYSILDTMHTVKDYNLRR